MEPHANTPEVDINTFYKTISAKGKAVMKQRRSQGEIMHKAPLGYKNARDKDGRSILVIDPKTYPLVQKAKDLRAQGMSIRKICAVMEERGLRTQRGGTFGPSSMLKILKRQSVHAQGAIERSSTKP
ncbi:MAG: recombinase family protein [Armatimonadetes bacterium]|nr:recombinase family protein [Armatimonadota bacterium]